ncbi:MAG: hypothetical protein H7099_06935 [Gemmatimonadaceae bacterium]|nr:hypothetical protein [Gemmatimonadaceae bacterium]
MHIGAGDAGHPMTRVAGVLRECAPATVGIAVRAARERRLLRDGGLAPTAGSIGWRRGDFTPSAAAGLSLVSVVAVGLLLCLLGSAALAFSRAPPALRTVCTLRLGAAVLALIATLWTTLPMFVVSACGDRSITSAS